MNKTPAEISEPLPGRNRQWRLIKPISKQAGVSPQHFEFDDSPVPSPEEGEILVRTICLGTSPAQRSYISTSTSMHEKVAAGEVMRGRGIGQVMESRSGNYAVGDMLIASTGWQDFSVLDGSSAGPYPPEKLICEIRPCSLALGLLGGAGLTAYFGLTDVGLCKPGDTVLVSAAAGGVGSCAVQIARVLGCRVVGIAGGPEKCGWLKDTLGVETTIDYKNDDLEQALDLACPDGIDVFFDNVGGEQLELALQRLSIGARVVICGFISTDYEESSGGPANYVNLLRRRARMEGFFVFDYRSRFPEVQAQLLEWHRHGLMQATDDVLYGLEHMPAALQSLFTGSNMGVRSCQVSPDP
jgi:NADPH-dependent curcumin reductase CurA